MQHDMNCHLRLLDNAEVPYLGILFDENSRWLTVGRQKIHLFTFVYRQYAVAVH